MKHYFFIIILLLTYVSQGQVSNFNKAKLTKKNGDIQDVFYKEKQYIIDQKGKLNIYSSPSSSNRLIITPNNFSKIEADGKNIIVVSAYVEELDKNEPILLRKLVDGNHSLYKYVNSIGESTFVNKSNGNYSKFSNNAKNKDNTYYKEWLYRNLNPQKNDVSSYNSLKYNQDDLISYYINNQSNSVQLTQEEKVKTFNLSIHSGILINTISGDLFDAEEAKSTSLKIGVQGLINLDPVKNNHSLFGGLTYYTDISGTGSYIASRQSQYQRRNIDTEIELSLWSIQLGYQYNFHINKISISTFFSFEPMFFLSDNSVEAISQEDQSQVFITNLFEGNPKSYNLGLKISTQQNLFVSLEYSTLTDIIALQPVVSSGGFIKRHIDLSYFSVGIGYKVF
ncbi:hypothetical protein [Winogradskyella costae]|uniref:hypothetical protein n=1 Tax=Winogradskyella costae TaxID=2697008 RepID=UPI0015C7337E|nr:hypothetical protein [Winogradskyella costae]